LLVDGYFIPWSLETGILAVYLVMLINKSVSQSQGERFDQWGEAYFSSRAKNEGTDPSEYWQKRRQAVLDNTGYFFMVCSLLPSLSSLSFCCSRPPLVLSFDSVK